MIHDYFLQIRANASAAGSAAAVLAGLEDALPATQLGDAKQVQRSMAEIDELAQDALELPQSDLEGKRSIAGRIRTLAQAAAASSASIMAHANSASTMPLPPTASAVDGYTVQILKNGSLHRDTSFGVSGKEADTSAPVVGGATATSAARGEAGPTADTGQRATATAKDEGGDAARAVATDVAGAANRQSTAVTAARNGPATRAAVTRMAATEVPPVRSSPDLAGALASPTVAAASGVEPGGQLPLALSTSERQAGEQSAPPEWPATSLAGEVPVASAPESAPAVKGRGPNLGILAVGMAVLAMAAFWLRQRL